MRTEQCDPRLFLRNKPVRARHVQKLQLLAEAPWRADAHAHADGDVDGDGDQAETEFPRERIIRKMCA